MGTSQQHPKTTYTSRLRNPHALKFESSAFPFQYSYALVLVSHTHVTIAMGHVLGGSAEPCCGTAPCAMC